MGKGQRIWRYTWLGRCLWGQWWIWLGCHYDWIHWWRFGERGAAISGRIWSNSYQIVRYEAEVTCPGSLSPYSSQSKKQNLLYKRVNKTSDFRKYKLARNKTLSDIRSAKLSYYCKLNPRNPKKFWKDIYQVPQQELKIHTNTYSWWHNCNNRKKADLLSSFFHLCFNLL